MYALPLDPSESHLNGVAFQNLHLSPGRQISIAKVTSTLAFLLLVSYGGAVHSRRACADFESYTHTSAGSTTMHRKDMIDVFLRNLPPSHALHTSKRLVRYERATYEDPQQQRLILYFADGTTARADVLVGADGIHSVTRECMYERAHKSECDTSDVQRTECPRCKAADPIWTGVTSYRCLIPTAKLYALNPNHTTASIGAILCVSIHDVVVSVVSGSCSLARLRQYSGNSKVNSWSRRLLS